ncbi:DUF1963 domain-containing protein [Novosphingobium cyanobacteriorum]|uniref:DUF1963 domain-containing protein n=1 Tax=Novosphingobium cyanobacteriorum TaxID=3024215 RepID=A0ABT6CHS0_9SPHN|nr:DUF1963 domain-containing protein [Novosphingobium cyanobacteriorum]MDF8333461.1 DUF1963 domain-containing protein [Novosphingobium cyanobacteriorum]
MLTEGGMDPGLIVLAAIFLASMVCLIGLIVYLLRKRSPRVQRRQRDAKADKALQKQARQSGGRKRTFSVSALEGEEPIAPAPTEEQPQDTAPEAARQPIRQARAIVLRQHFPPLAGAGSRSFYGGMPQVGRAFPWPRNAEGQPLHFLLQVDCAQVPYDVSLGNLPARGTLLFFMELDGRTPPACHVAYDPPSTGPLQELAPPDDLAAAYGEGGSRFWPWALSDEQGTPILPQWPFDPVATPLDEDGRPPIDALVALQGEDHPADPFGPQDFDGMACPWDGFPQDWLSVQIATALLVREIDRETSHLSASLEPAAAQSAHAERLIHVREEALAWFDHAMRNPAFALVGTQERQVFWQWFAAQVPFSLEVAPAVLEAAVETTLHAHPEAATRVPVEILLRVIHRHLLVTRTDEGYHVQAPARMLGLPSTAPAAEQGLARSHILLLELGSDPAIGHHFGEAIHRFWITPDDAAALRFDRVIVTTTDT